jgi:hypothetical protein
VRDEAFVRSEVRWLIERARTALDLPPEAVAGCTEEQIAEVFAAQQVAALPPSLDELIRLAGVQTRGTVLGELFPATGVGWETMLFAKRQAQKTASISGTKEEFGPDRVVFLSDPGGTVLWVETGEVDPPVWCLTEATLLPAYIGYARLACWLEEEVVKVESDWPSADYWARDDG